MLHNDLLINLNALDIWHEKDHMSASCYHSVMMQSKGWQIVAQNGKKMY